MFPRIFQFGSFTLYSFGVLYAVGVIAAIFIVRRGARRAEIDQGKATDLALWVMLGVMLGAKLLMVLTDLNYYLAHPGELFSLSFLQAGGVFYGGFLGALVAAALYFRRSDLPVWKTTDIFAPAIALGHAIGRLGCFAAGDDYGTPTTLPWGVRFSQYSHDNFGTPIDQPLHPVQLYEAGGLVLLLVLLLWWSKRKAFDGQIFLFYVLLYAALRFVVEFFRGDADRGFVFGGALSTSQMIALVLAPIAVVLLALKVRAATHHQGQRLRRLTGFELKR